MSGRTTIALAMGVGLLSGCRVVIPVPGAWLPPTNGPVAAATAPRDALSGVLRGPDAGMIAELAAEALPEPGPRGQGGSVVSRARYTLADASWGRMPLAGVRVDALGLDGERLTDERPVTDEQGRFAFQRIAPTGPLVFLRAAFTLGDRPFTIEAVVPAPRGQAVEVPLDPVSTLVSKKVGALMAQQPTLGTRLTAPVLQALAQEVRPLVDERAAGAALVLPPAAAAHRFDTLLVAAPEARLQLVHDLGDLGPLVVLQPEPVAPAPAWPATYPAEAAQAYPVRRTPAQPARPAPKRK